ncbi:hypothetical protein [Aquimarina pacifica]|uniref:hypothetical protein n=1 Tax=Aquimarina pacifica TaxID=1296415 RepID=UPI0004708184|nr:hypothetical protein [Aquimarina pacifica]
MRNSILYMVLIVIVLSLLLSSCENKENELQEVQEIGITNEEPTEDAIFATEVNEESKEVALVQKNGHEYRFISVGDKDDMIILEKLYGAAEKNNEKSNLKKDQTPFDVFVSITDNDLEVPERIAKTAKGFALEVSRRAIRYNQEPIEILDFNQQEYINDRVSDVIAATKCNDCCCDGTPLSTATDIKFCDNGPLISLVRNSYYNGAWREVDDIYTCTNESFGVVRVQFYAWKSSGFWPFTNWSWHLQYQNDFSDGLWWATYYSSEYTERQVRRTQIGRGSFSAYTRFF